MNNEFEIEQSLLGGLMKLGNDQSDISNFVLGNLKPNSFVTVICQDSTQIQSRVPL